MDAPLPPNHAPRVTTEDTPETSLLSPPPSPAPSRSRPTFAELDDLLSIYKQRFKVWTLVEPPNVFTFREQFHYLLVEVTAYPDVDLQPLREMLELYTLLLFLHHNTTSDVLLADGRLRLGVCTRDEVTPRIRVRIGWVRYSVKGEWIHGVDTAECARALWNGFLALFDYDTPQPRLSDHYYETRRMILALYEVDEAFVKSAEARVRLSWKWAPALVDLMETMPTTALRRLELIAPSTPLLTENESRTRLLFQEVTTSMELKEVEYQEVARHTRPWVTAADGVKYLTLNISSEWTPDDALAFIALLNQGLVEDLELKVHTARALGFAMDICAQVETVTAVTVTIKITDPWNAGDMPLRGLTHASKRGSGLRTLRIQVNEMPAMSDFVNTMMLLLDGECPSTRTAIGESGELQLVTRVNEPTVTDLVDLLPLLEKVGKHIKLLHTDSYGSSEFFNEDTYNNSPEAFKIEPLLVACPHLRVLNMQGAIFDDLPEMYEKGLARMQTLQIQWAPEASAVALAKALSAPESKIARHLVEFSTRVASDAVVEGFVQTLDRNQRFQYLRVGRRPQGDEHAAALNAHHKLVIAPGGAAFGELLDSMADAGSEQAALARECVDDDVLESIAEFAGPTLYRQIHMR